MKIIFEKQPDYIVAALCGFVLLLGFLGTFYALPSMWTDLKVRIERLEAATGVTNTPQASMGQ